CFIFGHFLLHMNMRTHSFDQLSPHCIYWIETRKRILKNHCAFISPNPLHFLFTCLQSCLSLVQDFSFWIVCLRGWLEFHQLLRQNTFTASRSSNYSYRLSGPNLKRYTVHRLYHT